MRDEKEDIGKIIAEMFLALFALALQGVMVIGVIVGFLWVFFLCYRWLS
jgi:uncharacterized membrane protein YqjE